MNLVLRDIVEKSGNSWQEGVIIENVFVDSKGVRGVEFCDTATGKVWYQPCSSAVLSLGYTCSYKFEQPQKNLLGSLLNNLEHLCSLFGDRLISILSMDSCPRAINAQNDVQFHQVAPAWPCHLPWLGWHWYDKGWC